MIEESMPRISRGEYDLIKCCQWYLRYLHAKACNCATPCNGFDPETRAETNARAERKKVLKEILRLRKQDQDERDEQESLLDLYLRAMQNAEPAQLPDNGVAVPEITKLTPLPLMPTVAPLQVTSPPPPAPSAT